MRSPPPRGTKAPLHAARSHTKGDSVQFTVHAVGSISTNQMTTTIKGRTAVGALAGRLNATHTFDVTADFVVNGTVVTEATSSTVDAPCAFSL